MLSDLRQDRERIGEAIIALERLAQRHGKRRGRPPAWMAALFTARTEIDTGSAVAATAGSPTSIG